MIRLVRRGYAVVGSITLAVIAGLLAVPAYAGPTDVVSSFSLTATGATSALSGSSFSLRWQITTNAASADVMTAPVVTVSLPDNSCVTGVNPSSVGSVTPTVVRSGGQYNINWALDDLSGGHSYSVPLIVYTNSGKCTDQQTIDVTAQAADSSGDVLQADGGAPLKFTTTTGMPTVSTSTPDMDSRYLPPVAISYGGQSEDGGVTLSTDPSKLSLVPFNFDADWTTGKLGLRNCGTLVVRDTLPPGASFDAAANPVWVLSADGTYAEYSMDWTDGFPGPRISGVWGVSALRLNLTFPGAVIGQTLTNTAQLTCVPLNPVPGEKAYTAIGVVQFTLTANWAPALVLSVGPASTVYDVQASRALGTGFDVYLKNVSTTTAMTFDVTDYSALSTALPSNDVAGQDLDARLHFDSLTFNRNVSQTWPGWGGVVDVLTCVDSGPASLLTTITVSATSPVNVPLPNGPAITCVELRGHNGASLSPGQSLSVTVNTAFRDPAAAILPDASIVWLYNSAYLDATWSDNRTLVAASTGMVAVLPYGPQVWGIQTVEAGPLRNGGEGSQVIVGDPVRWHLSAMPLHAVPGLTALNDFTIIDLLPQGFAYVPGSCSHYSGYYPIVGGAAVGLPEPTVTSDYRGSGRQALIWELGTIAFSPEPDQHGIAGILFDTIVTPDAPPGVASNAFYVTWTGGDGVSAGTSDGHYALPDIYDLNGNGDTTEQLPGAVSTVKYVPPQALLTSVRVQGSQDSTMLVAPQHGTSTATAADLGYSVRLNNNSIQDITSLTIIDALPAVGDTTLSPNTGGVVKARDSQFAVHLTGPVTPPAGLVGYSISYTTDPIAGRTAQQLNTGATWVSSVADWSAVTAFRITMDTGTLLPQGATAAFTVPATAAAGADGQFAYNSFATSVDARAANFFESGLAGVTLQGPRPTDPPVGPPAGGPPTATHRAGTGGTVASGDGWPLGLGLLAMLAGAAVLARPWWQRGYAKRNG